MEHLENGSCTRGLCLHIRRMFLICLYTQCLLTVYFICSEEVWQIGWNLAANGAKISQIFQQPDMMTRQKCKWTICSSGWLWRYLLRMSRCYSPAESPCSFINHIFNNNDTMMFWGQKWFFFCFFNVTYVEMSVGMVQI